MGQFHKIASQGNRVRLLYSLDQVKMSTIVDHQIRWQARNNGLVEPFESEQVNPCSYDVRLGPNILTEGLAIGPAQLREPWTKRSIENNVYWLDPGEFVLAATLEMVRIPLTMECVFQLKSSRGREGYNHALAGFIDPGFTGRITLELQNINKRHKLPLKAGMLIGQLRFMRLDEIPLRSYAVTGHYNNDMDVSGSKVSALPAN